MDESFKRYMAEWVSLKVQLAGIRKDTQILTRREKELRQVITKHMKDAEIGTVNVKDDKVKFKTTPGKKKTIPKALMDVIHRGLLHYFGGDVVKVEGALNSIIDVLPETEERDSITLRTVKKED